MSGKHLVNTELSCGCGIVSPKEVIERKAVRCFTGLLECGRMHQNVTESTVRTRKYQNNWSSNVSPTVGRIWPDNCYTVV